MDVCNFISHIHSFFLKNTTQKIFFIFRNFFQGAMTFTLSFLYFFGLVKYLSFLKIC